MKKTKTKTDTVTIGRLGPATNLRPAGAHKDRRHVSRAKMKAALRKEPLD